MFDCGRRGRRRLGNGHLRGVQVDAVGGGMVVSVGPGHRVQELDHTIGEGRRKSEISFYSFVCSFHNFPTKLHLILINKAVITATFIQPSGRPGTLLPISSLLARVSGSLCEIQNH